MTTFLWNHLCRWLREDSIPGLHWRWKISQFSAYNFTNLFLLPQWVLSPKGQFCGCHRKIPTSPFVSNPQGTIHRSCREAAGEGWWGRGGGGKSRKERGCVEASPETSLPLACIALPLSTFAVHGTLSIHRGPPHFHHMIHCPWTMLQAGLVLMSSVVSGDMFKNRYIWFGVSILGLVLGLASQNGWQSMMSEDQRVSVQEEHWLEIWKDGYCHFLGDPDQVSGPLWSSVYLSVKWTRGGISQDNLQDPAYMVILPLK